MIEVLVKELKQLASSSTAYVAEQQVALARNSWKDTHIVSRFRDIREWDRDRHLYRLMLCEAEVEARRKDSIVVLIDESFGKVYLRIVVAVAGVGAAVVKLREIAG